MKDEIILINSKESIDIVKGFCLTILRENGFDVRTITTRTFTISIYYRYPWRKWYKNKKIKRRWIRLITVHMKDRLRNSLEHRGNTQMRRQKKNLQDSHILSFKEILNVEMGKLSSTNRQMK